MLSMYRLILKHRRPPGHGDLQKDGLDRVIDGLGQAAA